MRKRSYNLKKLAEPRRVTLSILIVFTLVAFLLTFEKGAKIMVKGLSMVGINTTVEDVQDVASGLLLVSVGLTLMYVASAFAAVPVVGLGLLVVGAGLMALGAWRFYRKYKRNKELKDSSVIIPE